MSRDRYEMVPIPKEEWLTVPIPLSDAGLARAHVDAARERISQNARRPPSTAAQRFWQLSGGIVRCAECGSALSARARRRRGKIDTWYACRQRYDGNGPRDCTHTHMYPADGLEETVWRAVHAFLSDPQRVLRQYKAHLMRKRRQMRGDPNKEVRNLVGRLQELEGERKGYLRQNARGVLSDRELDELLIEFAKRREEFQKALRTAKARQDTLRRPRENLANLHFILLQMDRMRLNQSSPQDRRRVYEAIQLKASVDREGTIRLAGIFNPDVWLPGVLKDQPADPSTLSPKILNWPRVEVVTPCNRHLAKKYNKGVVATSDTGRSSG